ncbi:MAG: hypothetical protein QG604_678 [Candidatus Dependentiae bacterium]|nr:hypothetical protein [Candidatus Dependentiae bacterium]
MSHRKILLLLALCLPLQSQGTLVNDYVGSDISTLAHPASEVLEALALSSSSAITRKLLRALSLLNKAVHATAFGISALSDPGEQFKDSHCARPIFAISSLSTLSSMPQTALLLAHDSAIAKKLQRIAPQVLKEVSRARIKNAATTIMLSFALRYLLSGFARSSDEFLLYFCVLREILEKYFLDHSMTHHYLERAVLDKVQQEANTDGVDVHEIMREIKARSAK